MTTDLDPRTQAQQFRRLYDAGSPIDPALIAERLGVSVFQAGIKVPSIIYSDGQCEPKIYLRQSDDLNHKRFHCAIELGYMIGLESSDGWSYKSFEHLSRYPLADDFSIIFARELLAPADLVRSISKAAQTSAYNLADHFAVPSQVILHQLLRG